MSFLLFVCSILLILLLSNPRNPFFSVNLIKIDRQFKDVMLPVIQRLNITIPCNCRFFCGVYSSLIGRGLKNLQVFGDFIGQYVLFFLYLLEVLVSDVFGAERALLKERSGGYIFSFLGRLTLEKSFKFILVQGSSYEDCCKER